VNPRQVLQERYPAANLAVYFAFIAGCRQFEPEPKKGMTHEHHICPRKQFPEYVEEPENLITLYTPLHMHAHRLLGSAVPELSRASAAWIAAAARAGRKGGRKSHENGTGIFALTPEQRSAARRIGGRKNVENGTGYWGLTLEQRQAAGRKGGRKSVESGQLASLRTPEHQAKAGRKGGRISGARTCHLRWHVKRGIVNLDCSLCRRVSQQAV
jgi:general stress protein YciG